MLNFSVDKSEKLTANARKLVSFCGCRGAEGTVRFGHAVCSPAQSHGGTRMNCPVTSSLLSIDYLTLFSQPTILLRIGSWIGFFRWN
jgi:hypothetical protein